MLRPLGTERRRAHDAYHRFIREGAWNPHDLWKLVRRRRPAAAELAPR
jgi:hypothetical protein